MIKRRGTLLIAGAAAIALAATACSSSGSGGGGGSTSGSASGSTSASTSASTGGGTAATGSTIKIGYFVSLSGPQASSTVAALPTAKAWADYVNANGGLAGGHKVEIVSADSKGDASAGQAAATNLVGNSGVDAIIMSDPIAEYAVYASLAKANLAVLDGSGYGPFWHQTPNFYDTSTDSTATELTSVLPAAQAGAKVMAVAACSEVASCAESAGLIKPVAAKAGMSWGGVVKVASTGTDYTSQCLAFKQKSTDYVYIAVAPQGTARLMSNCITQGYTGLFGSAATSFDPSTYGKVKGAKMVGAINGFPWWANAAPVQTFRDAMTKYASGTNYETSQSTATWASLELLRKALSTTTGAVTRATVLDAMNKVSNETLGGLLPQPVTFTPGKPSAAVNCFWSFKFNAGDKNPTLIPPPGTSGNGATGDLASSCLAS
ncbi:ABC transporter substrate-binding protein [Jatrophihabitans sp.]|uniref:ABC transporter substrate-binding protein n=1 Tax=Jatrophihabitans sp. TaxID=1932789 RepID=UPI0030C72190|nr:branched-chain amino acid transporter periplasmic protein [Jatrophihabitans sp.]